MFWTENHAISLSINNLLEKPDCTLRELLNDEDILQECNTVNKNLVEFLVRPDIIYELIQLIVEEPPDHVDLQQRYKYSSLASEVIASRIPKLIDNIAHEPKIMEKLYSFLDGKPPLNPLLASFFAKVIEVLFTQHVGMQDWYTYQFRCLKAFEYFKSRPDFLPKFLNHLGTSGILNALQYITQFSDNDISNNIFTWLDSQQLVEKLIALICGTYVVPVIYLCDTSIEIKNENEIIPLVSPSDTDEQSQGETQESSNLEGQTEETQTPKSQIDETSQQQSQVDQQSPQASQTDDKLVQESQSDEKPQQENLEVCSEEKLEKQSQPEETPQSVSDTVMEQQSKTLDESNTSVEKQESGIEVCESEKAVEQMDEEKSSLDNSTQLNIDTSIETNLNQVPVVSVVPEPVEGSSHTDSSILTNGPMNELNSATYPYNNEKHSERLENYRSANASQLICSFITRGRENIGQKTINPLFAKCISEDTITHLLESMFSAPPNKKKIALINGIQVLLVLLNDKTGVSKPPEIVPEELNRITEIIIPFIPNFVQILKNPPEDEKVPNRVEKKAVGIVRLNIAHLFMVLVDTLSDLLAINLIKYDVFNLLLDMFFQYDFNNFLHSSVESIVCRALQAFIATDMSIFQDHFFYECKLLERLNEAWDKSETTTSPRPGYMGHVIHMASVINEYNMCNFLAEEKAETWEQLKNKLLRAMANQNMKLASIHDDSDENQGIIIHDDDDEDNQSDAMGMMIQDGSEDFLKRFNDIAKTFVGIYTSQGLGNQRLFHSSYVNPTLFDDADDVSSTMPSIFDANSSPWDDISSDNAMQSGWADFGSLQETAGLSMVPNTFTCEAFAASQQDDSFELCNDSDKFLDDFADFRVPDTNIHRLEQIQTDTALTSSVVFEMPSNECTVPVVEEEFADSSAANVQQNVPNDESSADATIPQEISTVIDSLSNIVIEKKPVMDTGSSGDTMATESVNKCETTTGTSTDGEDVSTINKEPTTQNISDGQR